MTFADDRIGLILPGDDEHGAEAFYKLALTPWLDVSAHAQVIRGGLRGIHTAVTSSVRAQVAF